MPAQPAQHFGESLVGGVVVEDDVDHLAGRHRPLDHNLGQRRLARRPALVAQQALDARVPEPLLPSPHRRLGAADLAHNRHRAHVVGGQQHDPRPFDVLLAAVAIRHDRLEPSTIAGANLNFDPLAHPGMIPPPPSKWGLL